MRRVVRLFVIVPLLILAVGCSRDPVSRGNRLVTSGNKFYDQGKFKEASMQYRRAIQQNPKSGPAYYHLGLASIKLGDLPTAASSLRRALDTDSDNKEYQDAATKLADIYWLAYVSDPRKFKNLLPEIDDLSKKMLTKDPKNFDGLRLQGYMELAGGPTAGPPDLEAALAKFRQAAAVKPYQPELSLILVQTLLAAKKPEEAEKSAQDFLAHEKKFAPMYDQLTQMYLATNRKPEAEKLLRDKVENNSKQETFYLQLAGFYLFEKRTSDMEATLQRLTANPKDFPMARLSIGRFFFRFRDFDRARREYDQGLKDNSKEKGNYQKAIVELLVAQGKNADAKGIIDEVLKNDPKDTQAIEMRSSLQVQTGNPSEVQAAVNDLQALVTKNPQNASYQFELGRALMAKGAADQARSHLEEAVRLRPDSVAPKLLLAQMLSQKGDNAKALQMAEEVIRLAPQNVQGHLLKSASLIGMGEKDKAKIELDQILKVAPNSSDAKFQMGMINFGEKNYKAADSIFRNLQDSAPTDNRGLIGIIETQVAQKEYGSAIDTMRGQLTHDPNRMDYHLALANVLVRAERFDEAIKEFKILTDANPKSADLYTRLGETYRLKGDLNPAIDNFRKASSLNPNDVTPMVRLAMLLDGIGRRDEAKPIYEKILRIKPNDPVSLNNLAYIKAEEGNDLDSALALAQRAKQELPVDPNIADTLGWIYIKKNLSEDAIKLFGDLVTKYPKNATYRFHLAMALYQKGDRPRAKKECEIALQNNPSKEETGKIKTLIQKL